MNAITPIRSATPVVGIVGTAALADSRDVAAYFRRAHKNVLQALRNTEATCSPEFARLNFQPVYHDGHCRQVLSHYLMTKDGFAFAVLGFTGADAARFKEAYIAEFNRMAVELSRRATAPVPFDEMAFYQNPDNMLALAAHYAQRTKVAEAKVEAAQPAVDFCDALADSDGTWGLKAAGKALHQGPLKFVAWLRERGDLYDLNGGPVPMEPLIKRGLFIVLWEHHGGKPRPATKLTGKGIIHYARELGVRPPQVSPQGLLPGF